MPGSSPRILEIGYVAFFKRIMPKWTTFVAVESAPEEWLLADYVLGPAALEPLLASGRFDVTILRVNHHPGPLLLQVVEQLRMPHRPGIRLWPPRLLPERPLVLLDFEDEAFIHQSLLPLLPVATRVFKRELPIDRWRLLQPVPGEAADEGALRADQKSERLLQKLSPLPLGLPLHERRFLMPAEQVAKTADLFFAGRINASAWPRQQGHAEMLALNGRGIVVDMPSGPLAPAEFYRRCAAASLTWSPQGYGWDCFRHYEAAACRSVPLINYPLIERHQGLVHGRHAFFYDPSPGGLTEAVCAALADKPRLVRMGEDARQHVLRHHTPEAIADRVLADVLLNFP